MIFQNKTYSKMEEPMMEDRIVKFGVITATGIEMFKVPRNKLGNQNMTESEMIEKARELYHQAKPNSPTMMFVIME